VAGTAILLDKVAKTSRIVGRDLLAMR